MRVVVGHYRFRESLQNHGQVALFPLGTIAQKHMIDWLPPTRRVPNQLAIDHDAFRQLTRYAPATSAPKP